VVIGWTDPEGARPFLGALLLGYHDLTRGCGAKPSEFYRPHFCSRPMGASGGGPGHIRCWASMVITPNYRLRHRRPLRRKEVLKLKVSAVRQVVMESIKLRIAGSIVIPRYPQEGLLANLLHVLEVVHRVRPDASVYVDWMLQGTELGFRYGEVGDDVWARSFQTLGPCPPQITHQAVSPVDLAFWGTGKYHLTGTRLQKHRHMYHSTVLKWLEITNKQVLEQIRQTFRRFLDGHFCIGIR
jgi:hypothetical protein